MDDPNEECELYEGGEDEGPEGPSDLHLPGTTLLPFQLRKDLVSIFSSGDFC